MENSESGKFVRLLAIYTRLIGGGIVNSHDEAQAYGVHERSIQRDISDIRSYLDTLFVAEGCVNQIIYDRRSKGYRLEQIYRDKLTNGELLAACKILLDSRSLPKAQMQEIVRKLITSNVPKPNQETIKDLIQSDTFHYIEPRHGKNFLDMLWEIGHAIRSSKYIAVSYERQSDKQTVERKLKPAALMFSEFYFYLAAFIDDEEVKKEFTDPNDTFPTIYRLDRIKKWTVLDEKFRIIYSDRFDEGEFKKRVQFMFGGKLRRVKFKYFAGDINAILDRLPTAKVLEKTEEYYLVEAEAYGDGINIWLNSQSDFIAVIN